MASVEPTEIADRRNSLKWKWKRGGWEGCLHEEEGGARKKIISRYRDSTRRAKRVVVNSEGDGRNSFSKEASSVRRVREKPTKWIELIHNLSLSNICRG